MRVALDAMGGDDGARPAVEGAVLAAKKFNIDVYLVGKERVLQRYFKALNIDDNRLHIVHADDVIKMTDNPRQSLKRKTSSLAVATKLVKDGHADALVSAGNTGAVLAHTLLGWRALPGIKKPAIATFLPTFQKPVIICDAGANIDCKPHQIVQFATMGSVYVRDVLKRAHPRVGLLSNGSEETKGNEVVKDAHEELKNTELNFLGNVEANDVYSGDFDVIACDGFVGNVLLKASEGVSSFVLKSMKSEVINKGLITIIGAQLIKPAIKAIRKRTDYDEYGGAPLLGVKGIGIKAHGRSNKKAYMNACRVASECYHLNLVNRLQEALEELESTYKKNTNSIVEITGNDSSGDSMAK